MLQLIAGLAERFAFNKETFRPSCGWCDHSYGADVSHHIAAFPETAKALPSRDEPLDRRMTAASNYWIISRHEKPAFLLSAAGRVQWPDTGKPPLDALAEYRTNGRRLAPLIDRLAAALP